MFQAEVPGPLQLFSLTTGLGLGQLTAALARGACTAAAIDTTITRNAATLYRNGMAMLEGSARWRSGQCNVSWARGLACGPVNRPGRRPKAAQSGNSSRSGR